MPELPEVESIKKILSPVFIGQKLIEYSISDERTTSSSAGSSLYSK